MSLEPVKIPQNVYVEDRIIGPITLRQIFIFLAGAGMSYAMWAIFKSAGYSTIVYAVISLIPVIIMTLFAIVKINGISLFRFIFLLIEQSQKPSIRRWQPREGLDITLRAGTNKSKDIDDEKEELEAHVQTQTLDELSAVLDNNALTEKKCDEKQNPLQSTQPSKK